MHSRSASGKVLHLTAVSILPFLFFALLNPAPALAQTGPPLGLPEQASARAEAEFEGELEVFYECDEETGRLKHVLKLETGRRMNLEFEGGVAPDLPTGSRIRARGRLRDDETLMLTDGGSVQAVQVSAGANTFGERRVVVMLVNFQDNATQPYSVATAQTVAFDQVNRFLQESSSGQTSLTGDVYGWFTLPMSGATCDTALIASLADQAAANAGVNVSSYSHKVYAFPSTGTCGWIGKGTLGGSPSRAYVNGSFALRVVAHELGHNLGLFHSRSLPCANGSCSTVEYGDDHDVMGKLVAHYNAFQKERLGWLNYGSSPAIHTVNASGTYWIDAYAPAGVGTKALKVLKAADSTGSRTWYYFEARAKHGFDSGIVPGVVVHSGSDSVGNSSYQIDLDPLTSTFDSILDADQTFTDAALGLSVKTLWSDASGSMVDVVYAGPPCTTGAPSVTFSPSATLWTQPGRGVGVTMTVKNNDAAGCRPAAFTLSSYVPTGWLAAFDRASLTLESGAAGSASLRVTPPVGASGSYNFMGAADRSSQSGYASGLVVVADGLEVSVAVVGNAKAGIGLTAKVLAGNQPAPGATVTFTIVGPAGATMWLGAVTDGNGVASVKWRPRKSDPAGTYQVRAQATAADLTGTGTATFAK